MLNILIYISLFLAPLTANFMSVTIVGAQLSPFRVVYLLCLCILLARRPHNFFSFTKRTRYQYLFYAFWLLYGFLTFGWHMDAYAWFKGFFFLFIGCTCVFLFSGKLTSRKSMIIAFFALALGILVQATIGWYEVFTHHYMFRELDERHMRAFTTTRLFGSFGLPIAMQHNPNNFATLMYSGIWVYLIVATSKIKWVRYLSLACVFNNLFLLILTESRGGYIALLISAFVLLFELSRKNKFKFVFVALIIFILGVYAYDSFKTILVFDKSTAGSDDARIELLLAGLDMLKDSNGFGVGVGQTASWLGRYCTRNIGGLLILHNWWIEILATYGVIVFVGYAASFLLIVIGLRKKWKQTETSRKKDYVALFLLAQAVGYVIMSVSSSSLFSSSWNWAFWGLCITYLNMAPNPPRYFSRHNVYITGSNHRIGHRHRRTGDAENQENDGSVESTDDFFD